MRRWLLPLILALALLSAEPAGAIVFAYTRISSNATTVVKVGRGTLFSITINTRGTTSNTATVYDNVAASGNVIAIIDTTASIGTLIYNVHVETGITVVTATGGAPDLTVASD